MSRPPECPKCKGDACFYPPNDPRCDAAMDESVQREKINEAIAGLTEAVDEFEGCGRGARDAYVACDLARELLRALPVEGWPEQLPTMPLYDVADLAEKDAVEVRIAGGQWERPLPAFLTGSTARWAVDVVARVVEPPKLPTRKVRADKLRVGMTVPGNRTIISVESYLDLADRVVWGWSTQAAGDPATTNEYGPAAPDFEFEVLDTETGAPE